MAKDSKAIAPSILLAEVLRLQRWAGGESVSAARIFGLLNGFESVIDEETESFGVSRKTQSAAEDIMDELDSGKPVTGMELKDRIRQAGIDETDFDRVVELCRLEERFPDALKALDDAGLCGAETPPEQEWLGSLHYMELHLTSGGIGKQHSVFAATIPRVGEMVSAFDENDRSIELRVVEVTHVLSDQPNGMQILIPHVVATDEAE